MSFKILWPCAAFIGCLTLSCAANALAGDLTIIPGKSIGKTHLGETRAQVLRSLGPPDESLPSADGLVTTISGLHMDTWRGKDLGPAVYITYRAGRVIEIETDNPKFKTADGISVLSPIAVLRRRFKHLSRTTYGDAADPDRMHSCYDDPIAGIAFVNTNNATSFDTVRVHRPGHRPVHQGE